MENCGEKLVCGKNCNIWRVQNKSKSSIFFLKKAYIALIVEQLRNVGGTEIFFRSDECIANSTVRNVALQNRNIDDEIVIL